MDVFSDVKFFKQGISSEGSRSDTLTVVFEQLDVDWL